MSRQRAWLGLRALSLTAGLLAACGHAPPRPSTHTGCDLPLFSQSPAGEKVPLGWEPWFLTQYKRPTQYRLVRAGETVVLEAAADHSASGLVYKLGVPTATCQELTWRWKIEAPIKQADPRRASTDDAPARVIVVFDGDRRRLDFEDRLFSAKVKAFTGQELPYATLIYAWNSELPAGSIVMSPHTRRIRTLALGAGAPPGAWTEVQRNLYADYRRAFDEDPGNIVSIALMSDADNTGQRALAWYGDIVLGSPQGAH